MAHSTQARKRIRQNEKRRIYNRSFRNEIKSLTKRFSESVAAKNHQAAGELFRMVVSKLDKAAKKNVYHRNSVARKKSKAAALLHRLGAAGPAAN
jgi:small subunit ribosomal protein S20